MKVIDTHAHFWNVDKFNYPWIAELSPFNRNFLLNDYHRATENIPLTKIVFVECDCHPDHNFEEVEWVEGYSHIDNRIVGIVAHLHLVNTNIKLVEAKIEQMAAIPLVKGIRHNIQNTYPGFALQNSFIKGIKKIHKHGMHFELCVTHDQMEETIELVRKCPHVQFVLDHCGKPNIKAGLKQPWLKNIKRMAEFENVVCKISGLVTEADWVSWSEEEILFYAGHAADAFGGKRIMFGSDWPVNEVAGGYQKWYKVSKLLTRSWSDSNRDDFYYNNANIFYRLTNH